MKDTVSLTNKTVTGLEKALGQDFNRVELPERMAWVVYQLKLISDTEEYFPYGKWGTIQAIEDQLNDIADAEVVE
uniref:Uncharacterized protein n=1 Tax=viral metagenome TaxID=1070528 RepID=A0A6H2A250_9ZZZZ